MTDQHTRRRFLAATAAGSLATLTAGCGALGGEDGDGTTVRMTDGLAFEPAALTVAPETTVTWTNAGSVPHTVTAEEGKLPDGATYFASGGFESESAARNGLSEGLLEADETFDHTFAVEGGIYRYVCLPHEGSGMTGKVVVERS